MFIFYSLQANHLDSVIIIVNLKACRPNIFALQEGQLLADIHSSWNIHAKGHKTLV